MRSLQTETHNATLVRMSFPSIGPVDWDRLQRFLATWPDKALDLDHETVTESADLSPWFRDAVVGYVFARRKAPGWNPRFNKVAGETRPPHPNNHERVPRAKLAALAAMARQEVASDQCPSCGGYFRAKRRDALYCSSRCRLAAHRAARETDNGENIAVTSSEAGTDRRENFPSPSVGVGSREGLSVS